jgi:GAF domain-containing protein
MPRPLGGEEIPARGPMEEAPELRLLFHRLNNQLGIVLAHAELLEAEAQNNLLRARATQVVSSTLEAAGTATRIRLLADSVQPQ